MAYWCNYGWVRQHILFIANPPRLPCPSIHERSAREKISRDQVAHVLNDEVSRKYIQSLKRYASIFFSSLFRLSGFSGYLPFPKRNIRRTTSHTLWDNALLELSALVPCIIQIVFCYFLMVILISAVWVYLTKGIPISSSPFDEVSEHLL